MGLRTFRRVTKSAACKSVSPEMSSTSFINFGSEGVAGGGGVDVEGSAAAVASVRERKAKAWGLV